MRHQPGPRRSPAHRPLLPLLLLGLLLYVLLPPGTAGPALRSAPGTEVVPTGAPASLPGADAGGGARSWPLPMPSRSGPVGEATRSATVIGSSAA